MFQTFQADAEGFEETRPFEERSAPDASAQRGRGRGARAAYNHAPKCFVPNAVPGYFFRAMSTMTQTDRMNAPR